MDIIPFKAEHLFQMIAQDRQQDLLRLLTEESAKNIEMHSDAYTAIDGDKVVCCAGTLDYGDGRGMAWSYMSDNAGKRMLGLTKAVSRYLNIPKFRRLEMYVDCDFPQAHRWARMLGFKKECDRMERFTADNRDCALYARVI